MTIDQNDDGRRGILDSRAFQIIALFTILLAAILSFYYLYLVLWPFKLVEVEQPYKVVTPIVKAGTLLEYEVSYCSKDTRTFDVKRSLININTKAVVDISDRITHIAGGCVVEKNTVPVPFETPVGEYKLLASIAVQANSLRRIVTNYESEVFEIIEGDIMFN